MNILVRNEERVGECLLLPGTDLPREEILDHPDVRNFIGGRTVRSVHVSKPLQQGDPIMVDLELRPR